MNKIILNLNILVELRNMNLEIYTETKEFGYEFLGSEEDPSALSFLINKNVKIIYLLLLPTQDNAQADFTTKIYNHE